MRNALKKNYENAANAYLLAFCAKHDYDFEDARDSWVGGMVGTITCAADCFVSMETIRMDIDRDAPEGEFIKWYDYDLTMHSLGAPSMNYDHWLMGAPRKSEAEIAELERLHAKVEEAKQALQDAINGGDYCRGHRPGDGWVEPAPPKRKHDNIQHGDLCSLAANWLHGLGDPTPTCPFVAVAVEVDGDEEIHDVFGWDYYATILIEVRISRSDFLNDAKKQFRQRPEDSIGSYRYYCCPEGIISVDDLPPKWGLLWMVNGKIETIQNAEPQPRIAWAEINLLISIMQREGIKPQIFDYRKS